MGGGKGSQRPSEWPQKRVRNLSCRREETLCLAKFPADFMFALTADEWAALRSQCATLNASAEGATSDGIGRGKREPAPQSHQQVEAVAHLPKSQQFVSRMLETSLEQTASR